jgi:hypothetical protein
VGVVYGIVAMCIGLALAILAVEYGRVQLVKTELQTLADAACRAAAKGYHDGGMSGARSRARILAAVSKADSAQITLADGDFIFGHWNETTGQFETPGGSKPIDSVKVTARRTVTLTFSSFFGKSSVNVTAHATGRAPNSNTFAGFVALDGMDFKNTAYVASYDSNSVLNPTTANANGKSSLTSNGVVSFKNNAAVNGDIVLGPAGREEHFNNLIITGEKKKLPNAVPPPPDPAWTPSSNPLDIPQNYTVNSNTTLPGGTYWFTSLTVNKKLTFSGPATVYVNGNIWTDDDIVTAGSIPSNLKIYQIGTNRVFDIQKEMRLVAEVQAPRSALIANNKLYLQGLGVYKSIEAKNNAEFYYDTKSAPTATAIAQAAGATEGLEVSMVE